MPARITGKARITRTAPPQPCGEAMGFRRVPVRTRFRRQLVGPVRRLGTTFLGSLLWVSVEVFATPAFDMREGVTAVSRRVQALHHMSFTVCVVVGVIVFGAMFYSIFAHRR